MQDVTFIGKEAVCKPTLHSAQPPTEKTRMQIQNVSLDELASTARTNGRTKGHDDGVSSLHILHIELW